MNTYHASVFRKYFRQILEEALDHPVMIKRYDDVFIVKNAKLDSKKEVIPTVRPKDIAK